MDKKLILIPAATAVAAAGIAIGGYAVGAHSGPPHPAAVHQVAPGHQSPVNPAPKSASPAPKPAGPAPGQAQAQQAQPQQALKPVLVANGYSGMYPTTLYIGAHNEITGITWSQWTSSQAVGTGQQLVDTCIPADCSSGNGNSTGEPVTVVISGVQGASATDGGHYTLISETGQNGQPVNAQYGPAISTFLQGADGGVQGQY